MATALPDSSPPVNYVLVDFENVHHVDPAVIASKTVTLVLLVGAKQTRLDVGLVEQLLANAASVQLIRLTSSGKNALDFTLAYYLGRAAHADPTAYFHIVSKDAGFDPLVEHLRSRHIRVHRHNDFTSLIFSHPSKKSSPSSADPSMPPAADLVTRALAHLRKNTSNRPKRKNTLERHLRSLAGNDVTDADIAGLINTLRQKNHLSLDAKDTVTYQL